MEKLTGNHNSPLGWDGVGGMEWSKVRWDQKGSGDKKCVGVCLFFCSSTLKWLQIKVSALERITFWAALFNQSFTH